MEDRWSLPHLHPRGCSRLLFRSFSLTALALVALILAACGGGGGPTTGPAAPKTETKAATSPAEPGAKTEAKTVAKPTGEPIRVGLLCDRSGPTVSIATYLCDGIQDWFDFVNNGEGGIKGRPVLVSEIDTKYEVPIGVDGYKKMYTRDNTRHFLPLGTPLVDALAPTSTQDQAVLWSPGFGLSEAADGTKFPYIFVGVATYHAQAQAAMQYVADEWKVQGKSGNAKVVYLFYDNPAGRDPLDLIKKQGPGLGLEIIDTIAVPATTVDMTTIMTQVKDRNPDYVISHLFGRPPSLQLVAAEKIGFPRDKLMSLVWGIDEDAVKVAGPVASEGYRGLQFAAHPNDHPEAYKMLEDYWKNSGKTPNPKARESLHYARGMVQASLPTQAARLAEDPNNGPSLKKGAESIKDFTANGLLAGTTLTPEDHGGTRKLRMYQVKDGKLTQVRDWFEGPKQ